MTAIWMLNRLPSRVIDRKTPYEVLFGKELDLSILMPFGCLVFVASITASEVNLIQEALSALILALNLRIRVIYYMILLEIKPLYLEM